ncbi:MAG: cobalamin-binding protein [Planctomycetota bacterium]
MRIVSLLPSATEIVCALGLRENLVGVTHECDYPAGVERLPPVTQTLIPTDATSSEVDRLVREQMAQEPALYRLDVQRLVALAPDLVITQELCQVCAVPGSQVAEACDRLTDRPRLLNLSPMTLAGVFQSFLEVGAAADVLEVAQALADRLRGRVADVVSQVADLPRPRTVLLEWLDPPFSAGHWNPELIRLAGGIDGLNQEGLPSRQLEWCEVIDFAPEVIVVACCGYDRERAQQDLPIAEAVPGWNELPAVRHRRVHVLDGSQFFNRPGPRLVESVERLAAVIHPSVKRTVGPYDTPSSY